MKAKFIVFLQDYAHSYIWVCFSLYGSLNGIQIRYGDFQQTIPLKASTLCVLIEFTSPLKCESEASLTLTPAFMTESERTLYWKQVMFLSRWTNISTQFKLLYNLISFIWKTHSSTSSTLILIIIDISKLSVEQTRFGLMTKARENDMISSVLSVLSCYIPCIAHTFHINGI